MEIETKFTEEIGNADISMYLNYYKISVIIMFHTFMFEPQTEFKCCILWEQKSSL